MNWQCRHAREVEGCSLCYYDLPAHMRDFSTPQKKGQAVRYLVARFRSVKEFRGARHGQPR